MTDASTDTDARRALVARDVHITYRSYLDASQPIRARFTGARERRYRDVEAVRGVDLTLLEGESLGLIGNNGSGKSSLLVGLAGLMALTSGDVRATSRPALLGVGAALNSKLSGRRNIELGCLALGLTRNEVATRMPDIIEFTGLEDSIDLPMKTYSSGMRARLAFTIATELVPDILLVDEALAVGDREFRGRAAARLEAIRAQAGAIIVVSHNLSEIEQMCTRVAWMERGRICEIGEPSVVLEAYRDANPSEPSAREMARKERQKERRKKIRRRARRRARAEVLAELEAVAESGEAMLEPDGVEPEQGTPRPSGHEVTADESPTGTGESALP